MAAVAVAHQALCVLQSAFYPAAAEFALTR